MRRTFIFFIDIDDTLIPAGTDVIPSEIIEEIQRLKALGHRFVISTGRALNTTARIRGVDVFQYLSVLLGSCIVSTSDGAMLKAPEALPSDKVSALIQSVSDTGEAWSYKDATDEKTFFTDSEFFRKKINIRFIEKEEYLNDLKQKNIMQLLICGYLPESITDRFPEFSFYRMPQRYTDVTEHGSKGRCIEFFKQKFPGCTTVAIGDSYNDFPMFEKADISIAMGNADDIVKAKATYVTKRINDSGLIHAFRNILKL